MALKLLFFHNSLPEYRIGLFKELNKQCDLDVLITSPDVYREKYGFVTSNKQEFNCKFLGPGKKGIEQLKKILLNISEYDAVELPPLDSVREILIGKMIVNAAKKSHVKIGYFWEKWEAPLNKQPLKRKIKNHILRIVPKLIYRSADVFHAGGSMAKQYFVNNNIPEEKITVIPDVSCVPECEKINIREKYSIPDDKKLILYFGRIIPQKGLDYLIKALAQLDRDFFLLIAGDGEFKSACQALAKDLKLTNVNFCGAVNPQIRKNFFEQCDIFVFPCTYRGGWVDVWGLTVNEAIQFNRPVVATESVGSAIDMIKNGVNGYRVAAEDESELVKAIELICNLDRKSIVEYDEKMKQKYNFTYMANSIISSIEGVKK